jgi:hypothetical protein
MYIVTKISEVKKSICETSDYRWLFFKDLNTKKSWKCCAFANENYWAEVIAFGPGTIVDHVKVYKPGYFDGRSYPTVVKKGLYGAR